MNLKGIWKSYLSWKQKDFLKWRDDLSEYERDFLIPELKGRCQELLKYCEAIDDYSHNHVDDKAFGATLRKVMLPKEMEKLVPSTMHPPSDEILARKFFTDMRLMNKETFIDPLKAVIADFEGEVELKTFGTILTKVNHICSTVVQVKEKLFLYRLSGFSTIHNIATNQLVLAEPQELKVMLIPFQNTLENIYGVANSTSQTIHQWHKEVQQWKTEFLRVLSERIAQRNNLLTIIVAIALSWLFMTAVDPFENTRMENANQKLKSAITQTTEENSKLKNDINRLNEEVATLKSKAAQTVQPPKTEK